MGDAKYKTLTSHRVPNSDLYQMLSYATALDLPGGLLVYAQGEVDDASYGVRHSGKRLDVASLKYRRKTLDETPEECADDSEEGCTASGRSAWC